MPVSVFAREQSTDQATLLARSQRIFRAMMAMNLTHVVAMPDNTNRFVLHAFHDEPSVQVVPVCREGEAWAIASGLWVGCVRPAVVIQNTGFLEAGDALRGTAMDMGVPLVALIDYRGFKSLQREDVDSAASFFEPTLRAWGMPYRFLEDENEDAVFAAAQADAEQSGGPVAVLMA